MSNFKWDLVKEEFGIQTWTAKVPGGYLVLIVIFRSSATAMQFIPDGVK